MKTSTECSHALRAAGPLSKIQPELKPEAAPATPPPSPKKIAAKAVQVVAKDVVFKAQAEDSRFQDLGEFAGAARNMWSILKLSDPGDPSVEAQLCTGIANRAVQLLKAAHAAGEMPGVVAVETLERRNEPGRDGPLTAYHTAVALTLEGGKVVVLDWHATLSVDHPKLSTPQDF